MHLGKPSSLLRSGAGPPRRRAARRRAEEGGRARRPEPDPADGRPLPGRHAAGRRGLRVAGEAGRQDGDLGGRRPPRPGGRPQAWHPLRPPADRLRRHDARAGAARGQGGARPAQAGLRPLPPGHGARPDRGRRRPPLPRRPVYGRDGPGRHEAGRLRPALHRTLGRPQGAETADGEGTRRGFRRLPGGRSAARPEAGHGGRGRDLRRTSRRSARRSGRRPRTSRTSTRRTRPCSSWSISRSCNGCRKRPSGRRTSARSWPTPWTGRNSSRTCCGPPKERARPRRRTSRWTPPVCDAMRCIGTCRKRNKQALTSRERERAGSCATLARARGW